MNLLYYLPSCLILHVVHVGPDAPKGCGCGEAGVLAPGAGRIRVKAQSAWL